MLFCLDLSDFLHVAFNLLKKRWPVKCPKRQHRGVSFPSIFIDPCLACMHYGVMENNKIQRYAFVTSARLALGCISSNSYISLILSQTVCIHNSINASLKHGTILKELSLDTCMFEAAYLSQ